jgi:hypothetical protein
MESGNPVELLKYELRVLRAVAGVQAVSVAGKPSVEKFNSRLPWCRLPCCVSA